MSDTIVVPPIRSARLELVSMTPAFIEAVLENDRVEAELELDVDLPPEFFTLNLTWMPHRLDMMTLDPPVQRWLTRVIVPRQGERVAMGSIGFHGPPDQDGRVEVGYTVFPAHRRQGIATEACRALFDWARVEEGITRFRASVSPGNSASLGVVGKLGLRRTGVQWDEVDGEELVFDVDDWPLPS
jgi:RimJ/RimL family protein N-acetyltransferase